VFCHDSCLHLQPQRIREMDLDILGYDEKWVSRGFLTEELLLAQIAEFEKDGIAPEQFRYRAFQQWLASKEALTNKEVAQYIKMAKVDKDQSMAGLAVTNLFLSPLLTKEQFEIMCNKLPSFGDWTRKLIIREVLTRRIAREEILEDLFFECFEYKKEFKDNRLLMAIIEKTENVNLLAKFESNGSGKQLRKLAQKRLAKLSK
jgi:hypothetical protein